MPTLLKINIAYPLIITLVDKQGDFKTGETVTYEVRKASDNSLVTSGTLTNTGNIYTDSITITELGNFYVLYFTPNKFENGLETIKVEQADNTDLDDSLTNIADKLCKVLGLVQSNFRLTNQVYDSNGCLTSATISIYNSATDTNNETSPIATYSITASYNSELQLIDYKVVEN